MARGTGAYTPSMAAEFPPQDHDGGYLPKFAKQGLTFDDVLLVPAESAVLPTEVSTATA